MSVMTGGALLVVPAIAWAIEVDPDTGSAVLGWRTTALVIAGIILVGAIVLPILIRNRPQDLGLRPDGDSEDEAPAFTRAPTPDEVAASLSA